VRSDASPTDWALCALEPDGSSLRLVGKGEGGAEALAAQLSDDAVFYGLVRRTDQIDKSTTIKFVFLSFIGSALSTMKRAKVSTVKGAVSEVFAPFHAELMSATEPSEVTSATVDALIHEMFGAAKEPPADSGASLRVGMREIKISGATPPAARLHSSTHSSAVAAPQALAAPAELKAAISDVRSDASPTDWALCALEPDGSSLRLVGKGEGGAEALAAQLSDDAVFYGLVRRTDQIDKSTTIKFVFLSFIGSALSTMKRAKVSTVKGAVSEVFAPFHAELMSATEPSEVTSATVDALVRELGGGAVSDGRAGAAASKSGAAAEVATAIGGRHNDVGAHKTKAAVMAPPQPAGTAVSPAVAAAIAAVRKGSGGATWVLLGYEASGTQLKVESTGTDGGESLPAAFDPASAQWALLRTEHEMGSAEDVVRPKVTRFTLLSWVGEQTPPLRRAKLTTLRGEAQEVLSPFNEEKLNLSSEAEAASALREAAAAAAAAC